MRYWHTDLKGRRDGLLWRESDLDDPKKIIEDWYNKNEYVWDCDVCGDDSVQWVFDNGETYILEYSWEPGQMYDECEDEYMFYVHNEHTIEPCEPFTHPGDRDWLDY